MLIYDNKNNFAYENYRNKAINYGLYYWWKIKRREYTPIANALNSFRVGITKKYINSSETIIDVGIGSGEFIKRHPYSLVYGYDINKYAIKWLKRNNIYLDIYEELRKYKATEITNLKGITMWDTLEHLPEPGKILCNMPPASYLFVSIPIYKDLKSIKHSKHYRPNEHYWYFTEEGFDNYITNYKFKIVHLDTYESTVGRNNIMSFVCVKK